MAYTAWSVVFGEQPTAAKWNQLGANDAGFKDGTNIDAGAITTPKLATSAATTPKVKLTTIDIVDAGGTNQTINSTSMVDLTGLTASYTSGATAERLFLFLNGMATGSNINAFFNLSVNGTDVRDQFQTVITGGWNRIHGLWIYDVPANTTLTIKGRARCLTAATSFSWGRDNSDIAYRGRIQGFAMSNA